MAAVTCLSCGKIYGAHFAKCIHCNAPPSVRTRINAHSKTVESKPRRVFAQL